jgi:hypothetical protein
VSHFTRSCGCEREYVAGKWFVPFHPSSHKSLVWNPETPSHTTPVFGSSKLWQWSRGPRSAPTHTPWRVGVPQILPLPHGTNMHSFASSFCLPTTVRVLLASPNSFVAVVAVVDDDLRETRTYDYFHTHSLLKHEDHEEEQRN